MARTPRNRVPKTTGAGVSRLSYQQGYAKGNRGTSAAGGSVPGVDKPSVEEVRTQRRKASTLKGGDINVSYGDTLPIGDLEDVKRFSEKLPARKALKSLDKTERTINDYAKRTPIRR